MPRRGRSWLSERSNGQHRPRPASRSCLGAEASLRSPEARLRLARKTQSPETMVPVIGVVEDDNAVRQGVVDALSAFAEPAASSEGQKEASETGDLRQLHETLTKLEPLIPKRKPKPCKALVKDISGKTWPEEFETEVSMLDKLIGKYKFKEALPVLASLMKKVENKIN